MFDVRGFLPAIGPILAYAEIHGKSPFVPNLLNNGLPEILADAPRRILRGRPLPILLLVKDSRRYPVELTSVRATLIQSGKIIRDAQVLTEPLRLAQHLWFRLVRLDLDTEGPVDIEVIFTVKYDGKTFMIKNNSYRAVKDKRLTVNVSPDDLPDSGRVLYGDLHYHSSYTDNAVEFGAPIETAAEMAKASGLSFLAVTDHSFDLEDGSAQASINGPPLSRWASFLKECSAVEVPGMTVLPGIEVSAGNAQGENAHLLILNPARFYEGRGDSGKAGLKNKPVRSLAEILASLGPAELAMAAHPFQKIPFLQRRLLRRGKWSGDDMMSENLAGLQIFNGRPDESLERSLDRWVRLLLLGRRIFLYAGNDAHGSFNRWLEIKIPYLFYDNALDRAFGRMTTGVYAEGALGQAELLSRLKKGRCFITTGPSIYFYLYDETGKYFPGDEASGRNLKLFLDVKSTREFGKILSFSIFVGDPAANVEKERRLKIEEWEFSSDEDLAFPALPRLGYVRVEARSERGMAVSNPIWFAKAS